ncbi:OLC1v1036334C1 [Oldenlandia corymbosa var. corymbosa]|uniref:OLC1v1036334C1 n=1 Tax=Oldenlandia corymbosa var. corymbosa TaxID=529605 RepID=A0AAV1CWB1_OLDCO|nr:OLC1v1036334C1 [Oldenlandia corymbosa var. corymbosa]
MARGRGRGGPVTKEPSRSSVKESDNSTNHLGETSSRARLRCDGRTEGNCDGAVVVPAAGVKLGFMQKTTKALKRTW